MEEVTVNRPEIFPLNTEISLYGQGSFAGGAESPSGAPIATKKEEGAGVTFTELAKGRFVAAAKIAGVWRRVHVVAGVLGSSLSPPAKYPAHPAH